MRSFLRSAAFQAVITWLIAGYLGLVYRTLRWRRIGEEKAWPIWEARTGMVVCFWHSRIAISPPCWDRRRGGDDVRALISNSSDGKFIAMIMDRIGFPAIRGSRRRRESVGDKGGDKAYREMIRWVAGGGSVVLTPDGPVGPAQVMDVGAPSLARLTKAPVMLAGLASEPCLRLKNWDGTVIPLPFARAALVAEGPFHVGSNDDLAQVAGMWTRTLNEATAQAEALVG